MKQDDRDRLDQVEELLAKLQEDFLTTYGQIRALLDSMSGETEETEPDVGELESVWDPDEDDDEWDIDEDEDEDEEVFGEIVIDLDELFGEDQEV